MKSLFDSEKKRKDFSEKIRADQIREIKKENSTYDSSFEKMIEDRLCKLDQRSIDEFYRIRENRKEDENSSFSNKQLDLFLLENLESSYKISSQHKQKLKNIEVIIPNEVDNSIELNPFEIKLLDYINGRSATNIDLPGYFTCEFNLNLNTSINRLTKGGFVILADLNYTLHKSKVIELKKFLEQNSLKKTGTKDVLISRIYDNFSEVKISDYFNERFFSVTEKGKTIIEQNPHIFFAHNYHSQLGISIKEICEYRKLSNNEDYHQDFIELLFDRLQKEAKRESWGQCRNSLYGLSLVYKDWQEYLIQATFLLFVCYYDYQGILKSFVEQFVLEIANHLKNKRFTLTELKETFLKYTFDIFPCKIDKQTFYNIFIDEITSEKNNL